MSGNLEGIAFIAAVTGVFIVPALIGGFAILLKHREKMQKLQSENKAEDKRIEQLEQRVRELEAKCTKLDERVADAHVLLSDETRQLDSKLNRMLPPMPEGAESESATRQRPPQRVSQ